MERTPLILGCRFGPTLTGFATDHSAGSGLGVSPLVTIASAVIIDDKGALTDAEARRYLASELAETPAPRWHPDSWTECDRVAAYRDNGDLHMQDVWAILLRRGVSALRQQSSAPFDIAIAAPPNREPRVCIELARCAAATEARHAMLVDEGAAAHRAARLPSGPALLALVEEDALILIHATESGSMAPAVRRPDLGAASLRRKLAEALLGDSSGAAPWGLTAMEQDRLVKAAIALMKAAGTTLHMTVAKGRPLELLLHSAPVGRHMHAICAEVVQAIRDAERNLSEPAIPAVFGILAEWIPLLPSEDSVGWRDIRLIFGVVAARLAEGAVLQALALQQAGAGWPLPDTKELRLTCAQTATHKGAAAEVSIAGRPVPLSETVTLGADADRHGIFRFRLCLHVAESEHALVETAFEAGPLTAGSATAQFVLTIGVDTDFDPRITKIVTAAGLTVPWGRSYGAAGQRLRIAPSDLRAIEIT